MSFRRPLGEDEEALARPEPVEIDLGGGLTFRIAGRIDRIDKVGPSEFQILDYKTGGFWRDDWKGTFNGGRRLQHALYSRRSRFAFSAFGTTWVHSSALVGNFTPRGRTPAMTTGSPLMRMALPRMLGPAV